MLSAKRDAVAAERFCRKTLNASDAQIPRLINVAKNAAYPLAVDVKTLEQLPQTTKLRQVKYLHNPVEQDPRLSKRLPKPGIGFHSFNSPRRTLKGYAAMNMSTKRQVQGVERGDVQAQAQFLCQILGVVASPSSHAEPRLSSTTFCNTTVFTDVDRWGPTKIEYFGAGNKLLFRDFVPNVPNSKESLSFLGVSFNQGERIYKVRITGNAPLSFNNNDGGSKDIVTMDDFIYGEPQPQR